MSEQELTRLQDDIREIRNAQLANHARNTAHSDALSERMDSVLRELRCNADDVKDHIDAKHREMLTRFAEHNRRLKSLETWRTLVVGGAAVFGFLMAQGSSLVAWMKHFFRG